MPYSGHAYDMVGRGYSEMAMADYSNPKEPMETKFKVGDRVLVLDARTTSLIGKEGQIRAESGDVVTVEIGHLHYNFNINDGKLRLISTHSPQPQQNQTKEDTMKPYAVIQHNLSGQQASMIGHYATEAEAKEAAEMQIAGYRANLTAKQFFTITILNTKTGELIGSVTDAPPQVDWAKK